MAVARMLLTKIEGKLNEDAKVEGGQLSISTNSRVEHIAIEDIGKQKVVVAKWGLDVEYSPNVGKIVVEGKVYVTGDPEKITEKAGTGITLVAEEARHVHQAILRLPLIVAVNVARELSLPLPMNFPTVEISGAQKGKSKSG
ncbi:MAG: hypothetical protein V1820_03920 [archaeon]